MSLNKNSIYCVELRSLKNADQRKLVAGYSEAEIFPKSMQLAIIALYCLATGEGKCQSGKSKRYAITRVIWAIFSYHITVSNLHFHTEILISTNYNEYKYNVSYYLVIYWNLYFYFQPLITCETEKKKNLFTSRVIVAILDNWFEISNKINRKEVVSLCTKTVVYLTHNLTCTLHK